jgi:cellulose biosynthesis protein BcsQ
MNVIVFASRKGGSGKSTLTAHLAAHVHKSSRRCLLIDCDPQGSLTLWHRLRGTGEPALLNGTRGITDIIKNARRQSVDWVFIDTPPTQSAVVTDAIRAATLVIIPARATVFDLMAVQETITAAREQRKPYAVVINSAPARRDDVESPVVAQARAGLSRLHVPLWNGQITNRMGLAMALATGEGAKEFAPDSLAADEISRLWSAIERSVKAIRGVQDGAHAMHRTAA